MTLLEISAETVIYVENKKFIIVLNVNNAITMNVWNVIKKN